MKLRRGFVKECDEYADDFRAELGIQKNGPLHSKDLAAHLEIPIFPISSLESLPSKVALSIVQGKENSFFAATISDGSYRAIVHNDFVAPNRQNSDIMHELSHIILGHPLYPSISKEKTRIYDPIHEREANELSFTLMITKGIALEIVESGISTIEAAKIYLTSREAIEFRIKKTDARRWADNRKRKYFIF